MVLPISSILDGAKSLVTPFIQPLFVPFLYWTLTSLGTIISFWTNGDRIEDEAEFSNPVQSKPYDFIIVGAGSAGCLLANRLSRSYTVLLLESGGEPNPLLFIPGFSLFFANYPELDWQHRSVPQRFATQMSVNGESSWTTGLGLGGTGNLNYMIHLRGHRRDFDNWAKITGDSSWSWEGVLPYFKYHENYEIPGDSVNHGYRGDLRIETPDFPDTATHFVRAGGELGYPNVDLNAPFKEGFDIIRYGARRGARESSYKAFLEPIRFRRSLTIMKFAQVNKILFRNGNEAYGVEYARHGKTNVAFARREVILSAGTVGSAALLLRSGIGPKLHLNELNIPVLSDLPVGENLQDHLGVYLAPFFIREGLGYYLDRDLTIGQFIKYFSLGRGRLTNSGCESTGIFSSSVAKSRGEGDWPDIALFSYGLTYFRDGAETQSRIYNLKFDEINEYTKNDIGRDSLWIVVAGARPRSRGFIKLGGSSPYDKLIIDPNYLGDPGETDLKVLLEGVKKAVYLMENTTAGGVNMGARFTTTRLPGCEHLEFRSDAYWICFIRRLSVTLHHPVGTAAMGSVVDRELRVVGVRNLRVADASVQPTLVTTNTEASTLMIAEKGADMILKYWRSFDQTGKTKNNKKNNIYSYKQQLQLGQFSGNGSGVSKGNNNLFWGNPKQSSGAPGGFDKVTTAFLNPNKATFRQNFTKVKDHQSHKPQPNLNLNELKGIYLQQEYPEHSPDVVEPKPISFLSRLPARQQVHVPGYVTSEEIMKQKLRQSFYDLKMVSELTKEKYDSQIFRNEKWRPMTPLRSSASTVSYNSSYQDYLRHQFNDDRSNWNWKPKQMEKVEIGSFKKNEYRQIQPPVAQRDRVKTQTFSQDAVPTPPSAPQPPSISTFKLRLPQPPQTQLTVARPPAVPRPPPASLPIPRLPKIPQALQTLLSVPKPPSPPRPPTFSQSVPAAPLLAVRPPTISQPPQTPLTVPLLQNHGYTIKTFPEKSLTTTTLWGFQAGKVPDFPSSFNNVDTMDEFNNF